MRTDDARKLARSEHPVTSHLAAQQLVDSGQYETEVTITAEAVAKHPGLTSLECATRAGLDRYLLAKRLKECETRGLVRRGDRRACTISKRLATVWFPAKEVRA